MNIPGAILQMVQSGSVTSSISSLLGLNPDQTTRATSVAVPSLLAELTGLASTPQGAERLSETVSRQEAGVVDNLTGALAGQGPRLAEQGFGLLGSLIGAGMTAKLASVLSRFTGTGEGSTTKLLWMLTPIVLGFLGKQQKSMGLDATDLANVLRGQKDHIRAAMPAGLETMLSSVLSENSQLSGGGARAAEPRRIYEGAIPSAEGTWKPREVCTESRPQAGRSRGWLPLVFLLGALAAFLFWSNRERGGEHVYSAAGAAGTVSETTSGRAESFVSDTTRLVREAGRTLAAITDPASAEAARPGLQQINQQLRGLRSTWNQLPESVRNPARSVLQPQINKVKVAAQSLLNRPGIGDTVRPQVDELMQNLNAFSSP
jgi:hypothetical protein